MPKAKSVKKDIVKSKAKHVHKILVKRKFVNAMKKLKGMKASKQRTAVLGASTEFIRDVSGLMSKLRKQPQLVNTSQRKVLKTHRSKLRKLIHAKTPINNKRLILL